MLSLRRSLLYIACSAVFLLLLVQLEVLRVPHGLAPFNKPEIYRPPPSAGDKQSVWADLKVHYPVDAYEPLPDPSRRNLPRVQHNFRRESAAAKLEHQERQLAVKNALRRCWKSYREQAWLEDELAPVSGGGRSTFGGWAATLVDTLDTLWIMDLKSEFEEAVEATIRIDFAETIADEINLFETTIRYLGGFLSAYDLSRDARLLDKSLELADMLYAAFDTPNRMPITRWDVHKAAAGERQVAPDGVLVA